MYIPPVQLKKTAKMDVGAVAYHATVSQHGSEAADRMVEGCRVLHSLRSHVVTVCGLGVASASTDARDACLKYLRALDFVASRVDLTGDTVPLRDAFAWTNAFTAGGTTDEWLDMARLPDVRFERTAVICTLANLEAALGYSSAAENHDLRIACSHFQRSAGYLRTVMQQPMLPNVTMDLSHEALRCLETAMLANAQMASYQWARQRGNSDATAAKVAVGAHELLDRTERLAASPSIASSGIYARIGAPCKILAMYFMTQAFDRRAAACDSEHAMDEELARLHEAQQLCFTMQQTAPKILEKCDANLRQQLMNSIEKMSSMLVQRMKSAEADNNAIYRVKPMSSPPPLDSRVIVKSMDMTDSLTGEVDSKVQTIFSQLLPTEMTGAVREYIQKVEEYGRGLTSSLNGAGMTLNDAVLELETTIDSMTSGENDNLSTFQADKAIVEGVREAAAAGGWDYLARMSKDVLAMATDGQSRLAHIEKRLAEEAAADAEWCRDPRVASGRPRSRDVTKHYRDTVVRVREELEVAAKSDAYVRSLLDTSKAIILGLPTPQEVDGVAKKRDSSELLVRLNRLRPMVDQGHALLRRKDEILERFYAKQRSNVVDPDKIPKDAAEQQAFIDGQINEVFGSLKEEAQELEIELTKFGVSTQNEIAALSPPEDQTRFNKAAEAAGAAQKWKEMKQFLSDGTKFYARELDVLSHLARDVDGFCQTRANELTNMLGQQFTHMNVAPTTPSSDPRVPQGQWNPFANNPYRRP